MKNNFVKVHSYKDLAISAIILVAGIVLIFVNKVAGVVIILCGLLSFLLYKSGYRLNDQGALLQKRNLELSRKCQQSVLDFLNGKSTDLDLIPGNEGGTLLLEVWYNKEEKIAYSQLFVYQELIFKEITEVIKLNPSNAQILIEKI